MKKFFKKIEERSIIFWGNMALLLLVVAIAGVSLLSTRRILVDNAKKTGAEIAKSYRMEEERNLELYQALLMAGSQYIEGMVERKEDDAHIAAWLEDYLEKLAGVTGMERATPCAVVNGKVLAAGAGVCDYDEKDLEGLPWYGKALDAEGEIIYTDVYTSPDRNGRMITIAKECGDGETVIAFDISLEKFRIYDNSQSLPENSVYFLCDSGGNLLYEQTAPDFEGDIKESSLYDLYLRIADGEFADGNRYYYAANGESMTVYYEKEPNGWLSVFLISNSYLMNRWEMVISRYIGVFLLVLWIIVFMWMRQKQIENSKRHMDETIQILGNSYYAFYRVNIEKETYEMIKGAEYVKDVLPPKGRYEDLLDIFERLIHEEAIEKFVESFSIRNVREQIQRGVTDFGGDFQRIFGNEWKWVNLHILYAPSICKDEVVLCCRQVEEEKRQELQHMTLLEDSLKAAYASDESRKRFFSGISHNMRTPLNIIIGMSEVAGKYLDDKERLENYLQKIHYSSKQLLGLINHILEMSRLDQGMYLENEPFYLEEQIEKSAEAFVVQAEKEKKDLQFTYNMKHGEVCGDTTKLDRIVNNLLSNALFFTKEGDRIAVTVNEIYNQRYTRYQLVVSDTGEGMDTKVLEQIDLSDMQEGDFASLGMGELGMLIVRNVVSLMNGEIDVESAPGEGTTVTVTLPFETTGIQNTEEDGEVKEEEFVLKGRRILLAEDYELNMELATDILTMCGAEVAQAKNGKEAVDIFAASDEFFFDAILMDMQMPVMNGCEATEAIRRLERADAGLVPIIAVTANTFAEDISRTTRAGMNAHVAKPIDIKILCKTLMNLLGDRTK